MHGFTIQYYAIVYFLQGMVFMHSRDIIILLFCCGLNIVHYFSVFDTFIHLLCQFKFLKFFLYVVSKQYLKSPSQFGHHNCFVCFSVETTVLIGNDYLESLDIRQYNLYLNFLALGLLALALFIFTYIALLRIKKTTQ